ncbi:phosphatidylinositol transfer protein [Ascodesmis nigricans]|uniref:Phosphatidylglycerol/phosphatidylinositol transfer protein n=1 Tax=Ascodesmis nigricans TaxID=341454 RepID=A0A4S2MTB4_9PEZI|nr:phosphatidylinositol transfer protein [Ascodesmis nigricans]
MKLTAFTTASLFFLTASASTGSLFSQIALGRTPVTNKGLEVPGENDLYFCEKPDSYILNIESVNLVPNPPTAGSTLQISAVGVLSDVITKGAYVDVVVKYGLITLIKQTMDLCEQVDKVDMECPIKDGKVIIHKSVDLPAVIPPGKYSVSANAMTEDDRTITCLTSTIVFTGK